MPQLLLLLHLLQGPLPLLLPLQRKAPPLMQGWMQQRSSSDLLLLLLLLLQLFSCQPEPATLRSAGAPGGHNETCRDTRTVQSKACNDISSSSSSSSKGSSSSSLTLLPGLLPDEEMLQQCVGCPRISRKRHPVSPHRSQQQHAVLLLHCSSSKA